MGEDFAGALSERVGLESWVEARDDAGGVAGYWRAEGVVFASVVPDGRGGSEGEARRSRRRWRVVLRTPVEVRLTSRLLWDAQVLAVLAVETDPQAPERVVVRCEAREA